MMVTWVGGPNDGGQFIAFDGAAQVVIPETLPVQFIATQVMNADVTIKTSNVPIVKDVDGRFFALWNERS